MSEVKKSLVAASGVVVAVMFAYAGTISRDRVDGVAAPRNTHELGDMVASRDDTQIPEGDYFYNLTKLLKREFVEPVTDDQKLASGAVRGMVSSLGDPRSLFMDSKEFKVFLGERQGRYEGIGAEFELTLPGKPGQDAQAGLEPTDGDVEYAFAAPRIPKLTVMAIAPGGPADLAGVKVGDTVSTVDGHWVVNGDLLIKYRTAEKMFTEKKIDASQLNKVRKEVHAKSERALLPLRAADRLSQGTSGQIVVVWDRGGVQRTTAIQKSTSSMPVFSDKRDHIVLPFTPGADKELRTAIDGKSHVVIDLRDNVLGDFTEMTKCLAVLAPRGEYGRVFSVHNPRGVPVTVSTGTSRSPSIDLIVDRSTLGAAQIFALALSSRHLAKLQGSEMTPDRSVEQIVGLPDGSGYTLKTGRYEPIAASDAQAGKKGSA